MSWRLIAEKASYGQYVALTIVNVQSMDEQRIKLFDNAKFTSGATILTDEFWRP